MLSLEAGVIHIYFCFLFVAGVSSGVAKSTLIGSAGTEEALLACLSTESLRNFRRPILHLSSEFLPRHLPVLYFVALSDSGAHRRRTTAKQSGRMTAASNEHNLVRDWSSQETAERPAKRRGRTTEQMASERSVQSTSRLCWGLPCSISTIG
jgi:hypothetical protein